MSESNDSIELTARVDNLSFGSDEFVKIENDKSAETKNINESSTVNIDNDETSQNNEISNEDKELINEHVAQFQKTFYTAMGFDGSVINDDNKNNKYTLSDVNKDTIKTSITQAVKQSSKPQVTPKQEPDLYTVYLGTLIPKERLREFIDALFIELTNNTDEDTVDLKRDENESRFICHPGVSVNQELYNLYYKDEPINLFNIKKDKIYECVSLENLDTANLTIDDIMKLRSIPIILLNNEYCVERIPCGAYAGDFMITLMKIPLERQNPCSRFYVHDKHILSNINPFIKSLAELGLVGKYKFVLGYSVISSKK